MKKFGFAAAVTSPRALMARLAAEAAQEAVDAAYSAQGGAAYRLFEAEVRALRHPASQGAAEALLAARAAREEAGRHLAAAVAAADAAWAAARIIPGAVTRPASPCINEQGDECGSCRPATCEGCLLRPSWR